MHIDVYILDIVRNLKNITQQYRFHNNNLQVTIIYSGLVVQQQLKAELLLIELVSQRTALGDHTPFCDLQLSVRADDFWVDGRTTGRQNRVPCPSVRMRTRGTSPVFPHAGNFFKHVTLILCFLGEVLLQQSYCSA